MSDTWILKELPDISGAIVGDAYGQASFVTSVWLDHNPSKLPILVTRDVSNFRIEIPEPVTFAFVGVTRDSLPVSDFRSKRLDVPIRRRIVHIGDLEGNCYLGRVELRCGFWKYKEQAGWVVST